MKLGSRLVKLSETRQKYKILKLNHPSKDKIRQFLNLMLKKKGFKVKILLDNFDMTFYCVNKCYHIMKKPTPTTDSNL